MEKQEMLYEGKAKKIFKTENNEELIVFYKDDVTALNGLKKSTIHEKGILNNKISNYLMQIIDSYGVETHFIKELSTREALVKKVEIIPLEVIVRNVSAGSFSRRYGMEEGFTLITPTFEISYKNDDLGDPLLNDSHAIALQLCTEKELQTIKEKALLINEILCEVFDACGLILVDFKLEFGKLADGRIILADEISPDTCRLWDKETKMKLDKDRFRRNLGHEEEAYREIEKRVSQFLMEKRK